MSQPGRTLHMDSTPLLRPGVAPHPCRVADGRARLSSGFQPTPPHVPPGQGSSPSGTGRATPCSQPGSRESSAAEAAVGGCTGTAPRSGHRLLHFCTPAPEMCCQQDKQWHSKAETPGGLCPTSTIAIRSLLAKQTAAGQPLAPAKPHCSPAIGQGCPRATQQHMQPTGTAPMFALWFSHTTTPSKQTTG